MLEKINKPNDIHKIALADFPQLADEIRQFLIESVSQTGGHLASNLGVVELTLALHNVLDLPQDKIVWDVGHQAYTHKILTGRKEGFKNLRKEGGRTPQPDLATGAEAWILAGGAHHTAFSYDLTAEQMGDWAAAMGIEAVYIDKDTTIRNFKNELRWNEVAFRK